eukprot:UN1460
MMSVPGVFDVRSQSVAPFVLPGVCVSGREARLLSRASFRLYEFAMPVCRRRSLTRSLTAPSGDPQSLAWLLVAGAIRAGHSTRPRPGSLRGGAW